MRVVAVEVAEKVLYLRVRLSPLLPACVRILLNVWKGGHSGLEDCRDSSLLGAGSSYPILVATRAGASL